MPNYIRPKNAGASWFFTVNALDRRSAILTDHIAALRHGLVRRVRDWPYSSFHRDVRAGLLPVDWGDLLDDEGGEFGERQRMW
jgi:hypothetical protein